MSRLSRGRGSRNLGSKLRSARLNLEHLEDRSLLATLTWINPAGGDWSDPGNWLDQTSLTNHVPTSGDDAVIGLAGITVTHQAFSNDAVRSLVSKANLRLSAGSLTLAAAGVTSEIHGSLKLTDGTALFGPGDLLIGSASDPTVHATFTWAGGTMSGAGTTTILAGSTWTVGDELGGLNKATLDQDRILRNHGALVLTAAGSRNRSLIISNGARVFNEADGRIEARDALLSVTDGGVPGSIAGPIPAFVNSGSILVAGDSYLAFIQVRFTSDGTVSVPRGNFAATEGSATGSFTVGADSTLDFFGYHLAEGASVSGPGSVYFNTYNHNEPNIVEGHYDVGYTALHGVRVDFDTNATTRTLDLLARGVLAGTGTFTVTGQGSYWWDDGRMLGPGKTVFAKGSTLIMGLQGGFLNFPPDPTTVHVQGGRTVENYGTIVWTVDPDTPRSTLNISDGSRFDNMPGAFFDDRAFSETVITNLSAGTGAGFTNAGTYRVSVPGMKRIDVPFTNTGRLDVRAGTLRFTDELSIDGNGILTGLPSATLAVAGVLTGGTVNADLYAPMSVVVLDGPGTTATPQLLEVMSRDRGNTTAGFTKNFTYNRLELANGTYVRLADDVSNDGLAGPDALYVNTLVVPAGTTLDLDGLNVYVRQLQLGGTLLNGTIVPLTDGGALPFDAPTAGEITTSPDEWRFFARSGQSFTITLNTGADAVFTPLTPFLNEARLTLLDPSGGVVAQATTSAPGADVVFANLVLPATGNYRLLVEGVNGSAGNYLLAAWNARLDKGTIALGESGAGRLESRYRTDVWTFVAAEGQPIGFVPAAATAPGLRFDLTGPGGVVFTNYEAGFGPTSFLAEAGVYVLTVRGDQTEAGAYGFRLDHAPQAALTLGTPHHGTLAGNGQAQLFTLTVAANLNVLIQLQDGSAGDRNIVYVRYGAAPTRERFDLRSGRPGEAGQNLLLNPTRAGTYYVLVWSPRVAAPPAPFTLLATRALSLTGVTPDRYSSTGDATLTLTGVGFDSTSTVSLVRGGTTIPLAGAQLDSPTQITVTVPAGTAAPGTYTVRVDRGDGATVQLTDAFRVIANGKPGLLASNLVVPADIGYLSPATLYVEYRNTGDTAIPAPLLELRASQTHANGSVTEGAIMTLDASRVSAGFWTASTPAGFGSRISFLGTGATPGTLQPGESFRVPVYYVGWQQPWDLSDPPIDFELIAATVDSTTPVDWAAQQSAMRPPLVNVHAWAVAFPNLVADVGSTFGSYVRALNDTARQLGRLGLRVTEIDQLFAVLVKQALGDSPVGSLASVVDAVAEAPALSPTFGRSYIDALPSRYEIGPFGRGWASTWDNRISRAPDGSVTVTGPGGSLRLFQPDRRRANYFTDPDDMGTLTVLPGGNFRLVEQSGAGTVFRLDGRIDYVEDVHGNRVTAGYTAGRLTSLTHSTGAALTMTYNAAGRVTSVTDPAGRVTTYTYDTANELLLSVRRFDGRTTNYAYQTGGLPTTRYALTSVTYPDGRHGFFGYDARGRLTQISADGGLGLIRFTYEPGGVIATNDGAGVSRTFSDHRGIVVKTEDALGRPTFFGYDDSFNLTQITDAAGQVFTQSYDKQGRLLQTIDPLGQTVRLSHSGPRQLLDSITDPLGRTTRYEYNAAGDLLSLVRPDGSADQLTYAPTGQTLTSKNRRQQLLSYTYDAAGRTTRIDHADGRHEDFVYDARGNLLTATNATGTTTFVYDPVTEEVLRVTGPSGRFLEFTYDAVGRRSRSRDQDGVEVRYSYDAAGRLTDLRDGGGVLIVGYGYDAAGRMVREDRANGTFTTYAYDPAGQLLHQIHHALGGAVTSSYDTTYDVLGRPLTQTTPDGTWTYTHDAVGQLTHAVFVSANPGVVPNQDLRYSYDAAGNRTKTVIDGVTTTYTTNLLGQYTRVGATTYTYDADGNLVEKTEGGATTNYTFDDLNRLVSQVGPDGSFDYEYDVLNNRIAGTVNGLRTEYLIDPAGLGNIVGEYGPGGAVTYTHGFGLVRRSAPGGVSYYEFDVQGNTVGLTNGLGAITQSYRYTPFGEVVATGGDVNPFQYGGRFGMLADGGGRVGVRARSYDPRTGHFLSNDPLGIGTGDTNLRRYAGNSPLTRVDPSGLLDEALYNALTKAFGGKLPAPELLKLQTPQQLLDLAERADMSYTYSRNAEGVENALKAAKDIQNNLLSEEGARLEIEAARRGLQAEGTVAGTRLATELGERALQFGKGAAIAAEGTNIVVAVGEFLIRTHSILTNPNSPFRTVKITNLPLTFPKNVVFLDDSHILIVGKGHSRVRRSKDPNQKTGPGGFGPEGFVPEDTLFPYRVDFENRASATAPAQRVTITDRLDADLDWNTFAWTQVGFGDTLVPVPGVQQFFTVVEATFDGRTIEVEIELTFDSVTGELRAFFQTLDPDTQLPPDVLTGFLPPEDGTGRGQGHIGFVVHPRAGLPTGTEVRNVAVITFDDNPAITTDQIDPDDPGLGVDSARQALNTLDAGAPTSSVLALPATTTTADFTVSWAGSDDAGGSGIASYDVYVSIDHGPFTLWLDDTTATSAVYHGLDDRRYDFYSLAVDNVGHLQATPGGAQAGTTVVINHTPILDPIGNRSATVGVQLGFTARATDPDLPANTLTFSLVGAPDGAILHPTSGAFTWTPTAAQAGRGHTFTIRVTDNGIPSLSDEETITVSVAAVGGPRVVTATQIDDGNAQRSVVRSLTLTFSTAISAAEKTSVMAQVSLTRMGGLTGTLILTGTLDVTGTRLTLKFSGTSIVGGSLADGRYSLGFGGTQILSPSQLHRLFGDVTGDGKVDAADQAEFDRAMNTRKGLSAKYNQYLDYTGDGVIINSDGTEFGKRKGKRLDANGFLVPV